MCTYLQPRPTGYYFRRAIPAELRPALGGKREFAISLRTKDRDEAKRRVPFHTIETDKLLAEAAADVAREAPQKPVQSRSRLAEAMEAAAQEHALEGARIGEEADAAWEAVLEQYGADAEAMEEVLSRPIERVPPELRGAAIAFQHKDFNFRLAEEREGMWRGRYKRRQRADAERQASAPPAEAPPPSASAVPLLATFDAYAAEQGIKPGTAYEWRSVINRLIAFLGHDDAARLTADDLYHWTDALQAEPAKGGRSRTARTVRGTYLGAVRATLMWAKQKRKLQENVAEGLTIRVPKRVKLREPDFTNEEAKRILSATLAYLIVPRFDGH